MPEIDANNRRIAKNTVLLYIRTIFVLVIYIYTSRIILEVLGVDDYGIYNAVGGLVAMFSLFSGSLSNSISRFITFELGHGDQQRLTDIFRTSVIIQVFISIFVVVILEVVGVWFLNAKMNIPPDRLVAANWVLQCSLIVFVVGLISVPYNACIIAHEHMGAFAYISVLDVILKLVVILLLRNAEVDRLIYYAVLLAVESVLIRIIYQVYCRIKFEESKFRWVYNNKLFKEMLSFAGWSFLTNTSYIFNNQGVNLLVNMYFGVALNAARGLASQVEGAVMSFVNNFTTAISPQITKSYATDEKERMFYLICKGAKFSFYLLLIFSLPIIFETDFVLNLWLTEVPEHTANFVRLSFAGSLMTCIGRTGFTACMATGDIKKYVIVLSSIGITTFFFTWLAFFLGAPVESCYIVFAIVYFIVEIARVFLMKEMLGFPPKMFIDDVVRYVVPVSLASIVLPFIAYKIIEPSVIRFIVVGGVSVISTCVSSFYLGMTKGEQSLIVDKVKQFSKRIIKR